MSRKRRQGKTLLLTGNGPGKPKYADDLLRASQEAIPGRAYTVQVLHDDWCDLLAERGPCNCNPEVQAPKLVPRPEDN